jgi:ankyrin repeat protein
MLFIQHDKKCVNVRDKHPRLGLSPLQIATQRSLFDIIKILVENGADVNAKSVNGETSPLIYAMQSGGHIPIIRYLVEEAGADVFLKDNAGYGAINYCYSRERYDLITEYKRDVVTNILSKIVPKTVGRLITLFLFQ